MGFLIFVGILAVVGFVGWAIIYGFRRPARRSGSRVYTAASEMELATTLGALGSADIGYHVIDRSPIPKWRLGGVFWQQLEIWVRDEDVQGARAVLGLDEDEEAERVDEEYTRGDVRGYRIEAAGVSVVSATAMSRALAAVESLRPRST